MKKTMKTKKMSSGGCFAAGGAAKVRHKEATESGAPMKPKGKKK